MRLLPQEQDRLLLFLAAELARARRGRGLALNQAEATALIADAICEAARDGRSYAEVVAAGHTTLAEHDVLPGVRRLVPRIEVEALFRDGRHLVIVEDPIGPAGDDEAGAGEPPVPWLEVAGERLTVVNEADVLILVTSHLHFFEVNRRLRFARERAWGMRLALPARAKLAFPPGEPVEVALVPIAGKRVVRGHGDLVDGPLDEPGAREAALARARSAGFLGA